MVKGSKANIRRVLDAADATDIDEGRIAYFRYNEVIRGLASFYGVPFPAAVAVFCALSPNNDYKGNLRSAATVVKGFVEGVAVEHIRVTTYNHCRDRAFQYLDGSRDFVSSVSGPKILSFYQNILNPMDPRPVTIDGHAVNIYTGRRRNLKDVATLRFKYETIADAYRETAAGVGILPNQLQAITWFVWKRLNAIIYPGRQLELFRDNGGDLWNTIVDPAEISTFPFTAEPHFSKLKP